MPGRVIEMMAKILKAVGLVVEIFLILILIFYVSFFCIWEDFLHKEGLALTRPVFLMPELSGSSHFGSIANFLSISRKTVRFEF